MKITEQYVISAIDHKMPFRKNGREVGVWLDRIDVKYRDVVIASISPDKELLTIPGSVKMDSSNAKFLNALLARYTTYSILFQGREWKLKNKSGTVFPLGHTDVQIKMNLN